MLLADEEADGAGATARLVDEEQTAGTEDERARAHLLLEMLTPIAKAWPSQWGPVADDLAIQVHGGYGYTRDYPVEQFYRDNRLNPIHEGTQGIQALDLLGRKVVMQGGAGLRLLHETITATAARASGSLAEPAAALQAAMARVVEVTTALWSTGDPETALANSSIYLEAVGHVVVAWIWLEQLLAAEGREGDFYAGKRQAAAYFFRYELPKIGAWLRVVETRDPTCAELPEEAF